MLEAIVAIILLVVVLLMLGILDLPEERPTLRERKKPRPRSEPEQVAVLQERTRPRVSRPSQLLKREYRKRFQSRLP